MNKLQKEWIAALRSGEYEQTQEVLQDSDGRMCCLGVLCELVDPDGWQVVYVFGDHNEILEFEPTYAHLPPEWIRGLVGLTAAQTQDLISLNDGGSTFEEIANVLEGWWVRTRKELLDASGSPAHN